MTLLSVPVLSLAPRFQVTESNWDLLTASVPASPLATFVIFAPPTEIVPLSPGFVASGFVIVMVVSPLEIVNGVSPLPAMELMPLNDSARPISNVPLLLVVRILLAAVLPVTVPSPLISRVSPNCLLISAPVLPWNFNPFVVASLTAFAMLASDVFLRSDTLTAAFG